MPLPVRVRDRSPQRDSPRVVITGAVGLEDALKLLEPAFHMARTACRKHGVFIDARNKAYSKSVRARRRKKRLK